MQLVKICKVNLDPQNMFDKVVSFYRWK